MWPDNETDRDFLNFEGVADTIAEMIVRADDRPVSIGVSGDWGVGKSSMIKLTKASLEKHQPKKAPEKYLLVEFNAWLYQGYDDARAALLDVIAGRLEAEAAARRRCREGGRVPTSRQVVSTRQIARSARGVARPRASSYWSARRNGRACPRRR